MTDKPIELQQKEFAAFALLRQRYRMRDAGTNKWDALCPAHDDRNRSLRVYRVEDRIYFRCYAGCSFNDVRRSLGLPIFENRPKGGRIFRTLRKMIETPAEQRSRADEIIATYDYDVLADTFLEDAQGLQPLADLLGVPVPALLDADCGRADQFPMYVRHAEKELPVSAWTWPMRDGAGKVTGLRLRFDDGAKRSFTGSKPGLFLGNRWEMDGPILIVEGPTDRAAGFAWGFDTVGLPSCNDGFDLCEAFLRTMGKTRDVVIMAQVDEAKERPDTGEVFYPGQDGARALAERIGRFGRGLRIITPATGYGDARKWYQAGASRSDVLWRIGAQKNWRPAGRRKQWA